MNADREIRIRLTARRPVDGVVVGVLRAAMDEELGAPVAELHLARPGRAAERLIVRAGQRISVAGASYAVDSIWPWNGRTPAGVVLRREGTGAAIGERLG